MFFVIQVCHEKNGIAGADNSLLNWGPKLVFQPSNLLQLVIYKTHSFGVCDHLEGWEKEDGREAQEGGDMEIYVYV